MSFADLKKQSSLGSLTSKLVKEVEKMSNTSSGADERLWKPEMDKTGNGLQLFVSFLPPKVKNFPGQNFILMPSKVLVVGILKTL
jgi:hypothetical protein